VLAQERLQLLVGRVGRRGQVVRQELHLHREPLADDEVVAVQAHRHGFPIQDLLVDLLFDQGGQLRGRRRPEVRPGPLLGQALDVARRDNDAFGLGGQPVAGEVPEQEEPGPDCQEMGQGLAAERSQLASHDSDSDTGDR
jgi:hypothetical protein